MGDDEVRLLLDRLGDSVCGDSQTGHHPLGGPIDLAYEQPYVVPIFSERQRSKLFKDLGNFSNGRHGRGAEFRMRERDASCQTKLSTQYRSLSIGHQAAASSAATTGVTVRQ
jgi:hypothetical protein